MNYKWNQIAKLLEVSRATLYRRLKENNIVSYSSLTDNELDETVRSIKVYHPNDGEVLMQGHLRSMNICVSRRSLRESIHRVDKTGVADRQRRVVRRKIYSVPYPNYVWHIDGHHKLVKCRFVIHGAIDGFSRMIPYVYCSNNNKADTVLRLFTDAAEDYGLPDHIRSDNGGENIMVWKCMIPSHSYDYSSVITGSSVHNERMERLWRDVNRCVC